MKRIEVVNSEQEDAVACIRNLSDSPLSVGEYQIPISGVIFIIISYGETIYISRNDGQDIDPWEDAEISYIVEDLSKIETANKEAL